MPKSLKEAIMVPPSGAGKQMYRATRIQVSAMEKRFKQAQKPAKKQAKAVKNFKK